MASPTDGIQPDRRDAMAAMFKLGAAALLPGVLPACASQRRAHTRPKDYEARFGPDKRVQQITRNVIERMKNA